MLLFMSESDPTSCNQNFSKQGFYDAFFMGANIDKYIHLEDLHGEYADIMCSAMTESILMQQREYFMYGMRAGGEYVEWVLGHEYAEVVDYALEFILQNISSRFEGDDTAQRNILLGMHARGKDHCGLTSSGVDLQHVLKNLDNNSSYLDRDSWILGFSIVQFASKISIEKYTSEIINKSDLEEELRSLTD